MSVSQSESSSSSDALEAFAKYEKIHNQQQKEVQELISRTEAIYQQKQPNTIDNQQFQDIFDITGNKLEQVIKDTDTVANNDLNIEQRENSIDKQNNTIAEGNLQNSSQSTTFNAQNQQLQDQRSQLAQHSMDEISTNQIPHDIQNQTNIETTTVNIQPNSKITDQPIKKQQQPSKANNIDIPSNKAPNSTITIQSMQNSQSSAQLIEAQHIISFSTAQYDSNIVDNTNGITNNENCTNGTNNTHDINNTTNNTDSANITNSINNANTTNSDAILNKQLPSATSNQLPTEPTPSQADLMNIRIQLAKRQQANDFVTIDVKSEIQQAQQLCNQQRRHLVQNLSSTHENNILAQQQYLLQYNNAKTLFFRNLSRLTAKQSQECMKIAQNAGKCAVDRQFILLSDISQLCSGKMCRIARIASCAQNESAMAESKLSQSDNDRNNSKNSNTSSIIYNNGTFCNNISVCNTLPISKLLQLEIAEISDSNLNLTIDQRYCQLLALSLSKCTISQLNISGNQQLACLKVDQCSIRDMNVYCNDLLQQLTIMSTKTALFKFFGNSALQYIKITDFPVENGANIDLQNNPLLLNVIIINCQNLRVVLGNTLLSSIQQLSVTNVKEVKIEADCYFPTLKLIELDQLVGQSNDNQIVNDEYVTTLAAVLQQYSLVFPNVESLQIQQLSRLFESNNAYLQKIISLSQQLFQSLNLFNNTVIYHKQNNPTFLNAFASNNVKPSYNIQQLSRISFKIQQIDLPMAQQLLQYFGIYYDFCNTNISEQKVQDIVQQFYNLFILIQRTLFLKCILCNTTYIEENLVFGGKIVMYSVELIQKQYRFIKQYKTHLKQSIISLKLKIKLCQFAEKIIELEFYRKMNKIKQHIQEKNSVAKNSQQKFNNLQIEINKINLDSDIFQKRIVQLQLVKQFTETQISNIKKYCDQFFKSIFLLQQQARRLHFAEILASKIDTAQKQLKAKKAINTTKTELDNFNFDDFDTNQSFNIKSDNESSVGMNLDSGMKETLENIQNNQPKISSNNAQISQTEPLKEKIENTQNQLSFNVKKLQSQENKNTLDILSLKEIQNAQQLQLMNTENLINDQADDEVSQNSSLLVNSDQDITKIRNSTPQILKNISHSDNIQQIIHTLSPKEIKEENFTEKARKTANQLGWTFESEEAYISWYKSYIRDRKQKNVKVLTAKQRYEQIIKMKKSQEVHLNKM